MAKKQLLKKIRADAEKEAAVFVSVLAKESDIALALLGGEWLDAALELLLRAKFTETRTSRKRQGELLDGVTSPLFSFGQKIWFSQAFGLINRRQHDVLLACNRIRNHFGHPHGPVSFDDKEISQLVHTLQKFVESRHRVSAESRRMAFGLAVADISGTLVWRAKCRFERAESNSEKRRSRRDQPQSDKPQDETQQKGDPT